MGSRRAAEWVAFLEADESRRHQLLCELEDGDTTGWSTYQLASVSFASGDATSGLRRLDRAASLGFHDAMTDNRLHAAVGPRTRRSLLERADHAGSGYGAELLAALLAGTLGTGSADVEAAASRADLRGRAGGAEWLGDILYARFGAVDVVEKAWARAERRGSPTAAFNLGTLYSAWNDPLLAAEQYRRAIAMGDPHGRPALAELLWSQEQKPAAAVAEATAADAHFPTWRSALVLGDMLKNSGNPLVAIDCYIRADALGNPRAPIELAELWPHDSDKGRADVLSALDRAERRLSDDTNEHWSTVTPDQREQLLGRVLDIRRRVQERRDSTGA